MANADLVIKNARLILPDTVFRGGLAVTNGKITAIVHSSKLPESDEVINAKGNFVLPGLIDSHVHLRDFNEKEKEDWLSGSKAGAAGGITTVLDMPNNSPPVITLKNLENKRRIAKEKSLINFGFHFGATNDNLEEIKNIENVASVKFYMGETTGNLKVSDTNILEHFRILLQKNIPATIHSEDRYRVLEYTNKLKEIDPKGKKPVSYSSARPDICAEEGMRKVIYFSKFHKNKIHFCHVSTRGEVDILRKQNLELITAEATLHHLFLSKKDFEKLGAFGKTNPPLRTEKDRLTLWKGINDGVIKTIATDHAPHTKDDKERSDSIWDAPAGVPGLETMLPLLLNEFNSGKLNLHKIVKLTSENPAKIFGIIGKGMIKKGYDADFIIVDMKKEKKVSGDDLFTKCGWSPFEGRNLIGWPIKTIVNGKMVYKTGYFIDENIKSSSSNEVEFSR